MIIDDKKVDRQNDRLDKDQIETLQIGKNSNAIILQGLPGTGKTYAGVERILYRHIYQYITLGKHYFIGRDLK